MATFLLVIIYIMFIGLGVPDSAFGVAWPSVYPEFGVDISTAGYISVIVSLGTIFSSLLSGRVINRFGTAMVTAASTTLTAVALIGYAFSPNIYVICIFAVPLGIGAGCIDSALNNYVSLHYKATQMNFLHCFYGIGVLLSPYIMSFALSSRSWHFGYLVVGIIQSAIAVLSIAAIPIWGKAHSRKVEDNQLKTKSVSLLSLIKMPTIRSACLLFFASTSIEAICTTWCGSFLVESKGLLPSDAATFAATYYLGLTLGRLVSGLLANKLSSWSLIKIGLCVLLVGIVLLFLPYYSWLIIMTLFLIGFGVGPIFPNLVHLTPRNFGAEISQSATGIQMASAYCGMLISPLIFGAMISVFSTDSYPVFLLIFFGLSIVAVIFLILGLKKRQRYNVEISTD